MAGAVPITLHAGDVVLIRSLDAAGLAWLITAIDDWGWCAARVELHNRFSIGASDDIREIEHATAVAALR